VTVTDGNGCTTSSDVDLSEPLPFGITFSVSEPGCFTQQAGKITVVPTGGVLPIRYSKDGTNFQASPIFDLLSGGIYEVTSLDANGCSAKEIIGINAPLSVVVALGDNQIVSIGDSVHLNAMVNVPFDSLSLVHWTNLTDPACPSCLDQSIVAFVTTSYSVTVTTIDGCSDEDDITVFIGKKTDTLVPNIFSPNGDNINDQLWISGGPDVTQIQSWIIFDRWGNLVFSRDHFPPNDPAYAWDGKSRGSLLNSGVFAYKMVVEFKDGKQETRVGDVTLVR